MLIVVVLVAFVYFGGSNVPKVLRDNKELLLGVVAGLVLCSFMGLKLEGFDDISGCDVCEEGSELQEACRNNPANFISGGSRGCFLRLNPLPSLRTQIEGQTTEDTSSAGPVAKRRPAAAAAAGQERGGRRGGQPATVIIPTPPPTNTSGRR